MVFGLDIMVSFEYLVFEIAVIYDGGTHIQIKRKLCVKKNAEREKTITMVLVVRGWRLK